MEGFWFYWFSWLIVIAIYFFDDEKKRRNINLSIVFVAIISSALTISLDIVDVRGVIFILGILIIKLLNNSPKFHLIYYLFISSILAAVFLGVHYFIFFEPVWLYLSPLIMISFLSCITVTTLVKNTGIRIAVIMSGILQGEIILMFLLFHFNHAYVESFVLGNYSFLDIVSISLLLMFIWTGFEKSVQLINTKWNQGKISLNSKQRKLNA